MKDELVRLGFEVGTGEEVRVPLHHVAVTGQTQQSGKTTTLEALVKRSGRTALTFVTKRGEGSFEDGHRVQPYFRDRADWQFVDQLLSAVLQEKNKILRPEIMKICRHTKTLGEVWAAVKIAGAKARGFNEGIYTQLDNYLEMIVPEIERADLAASLDLVPGINVMDVSEFDTPMQMLFVQSAIDWVNDKCKKTVVVIPEAWEFVPEGKGSPVKASATKLARKGAALGNFIWLDSQDLAGVDKVLLRACTTWIVGVQREANEIKRTLSNIPKPIQPKASDVALLERGQFFACFRSTVKKVYVQPAWMSDEGAILVARDPAMFREVPAAPRSSSSQDWQIAQSAARNLDVLQPERSSKPTKEAQVDEKEARELRESNKRLEAEVQRLTGLLAGKTSEKSPAPKYAPSSEDAAREPRLIGDDALFASFRDRLLADPVVLQVLATKPEIEVTVQVRTVSMDGASPAGRIARLLAKGFFDEGATNSMARSELKRTGSDVNNATIGNALTSLLKDGFVTLEGSNYKAVPGMKVRIKESK